MTQNTLLSSRRHDCHHSGIIIFFLFVCFLFFFLNCVALRQTLFYVQNLTRRWLIIGPLFWDAIKNTSHSRGESFSQRCCWHRRPHNPHDAQPSHLERLRFTRGDKCLPDSDGNQWRWCVLTFYSQSDANRSCSSRPPYAMLTEKLLDVGSRWCHPIVFPLIM